MEYNVIFSNRKTLSLEVRNGVLTVRAPHKTPESIIQKALNDHKDWIIKKLNRQRSASPINRELTDEEIKTLRKSAKEILSAKTEYYSKIMGLEYGRITITSAKTRFGSCSSQKNISYSYRLLLYPERLIDYVVVHELAHTKEMNHSKAFYKIIESVLPDYKERQKLLRH